MIRYIFLILFFINTSFACALCSAYSPYSLVNIELNSDEKKISGFLVNWKITEDFTNELKKVYDENLNDKLDKNELENIKKVFLDYIEPRNYLVHLSYDKLINKDISKEISASNAKAYIEDKVLRFSYEVTLNYDITKGNILYIKVDDIENYFIIYMSDEVKYNKSENLKAIVGDKSVAFYFGIEPNRADLEEPQVNEYNEEYESIKPTIIDEGEIKEEKLQVEESNYENYLKEFTQKVKTYLVKIKEGDNIALLTLLFISFIYGMIHAIGPGHGKSLAFSYFMANRSTYLKAFFISQASAFIHIVGALILVVISIFILDTLLSNFVEDSVETLTKVSALMIIALASYLLYNKLRNKDCACNTCCSSHDHNHNEQTKWSTKKKGLENLKPNFMKKDLYFVITSGLIPCPGTVILFIYAFVLETYFAVLLAAIFISLGMGVVIFASSFLGLTFHKLSEKSHKITNFIEILAPLIMILLGVLLYMNSEIF